MSRLVALLRVSTDRQAEHGLGLEVQEVVIKQWAKPKGHRIVLWTRDEGVSGSDGLDTRDGLAEALGALRSRQAAGLVVYRLDRLARDLVVQEQLLAEVWRMGAEVFSTSPGEAGFLTDDPDDPSRKLISRSLALCMSTSGR
jgi:DNA invertase Pin-like site-specific DNA recombinase